MSERLAHVDYVLSEAEQLELKGSDFVFISSPLFDIWNLVTIALAILLAAACVYAARTVGWLRDRIRYFRGRTRSYQEYIPLLLRFSLAIALINAGSQQALVSPAIAGDTMLSTAQIILGFLIMIGFALSPAVLAALGLCVITLIVNPQLINNLEIISTVLALLLLGQAKPGVDDLLGIPAHNLGEKYRNWVPLILRLGLGVALIHMAITEKFFNPHLFGTVIEQYQLTSYLPFTTGMWVMSGALIELVLGLALVMGWQTRMVSVITFFVLSLSFVLFKDEVYAHASIFGTLSVLLITGGGLWSLDNHYAKLRQQP